VSQAASTDAKNIRLSQEDVKRLLSEPSSESRVEIAQKIAAGHSAGAFQQTELLVAEQIFRMLLRDTETRVRAALAEGLKNDASAPKDIVIALASDTEEVALPVLENSEVLDDEDLIDIIRSHEEITKHIAIANRKGVSNMVSAALVETENKDVVSHLVKNETASISERSLKKIMADHSESEDVVKNLVQRANLPVTVVESLLNIVSDSVAAELKNKYTGVSEKLEQEAKRAREQMTLKLLDTTTDPDEVEALVAQLHESNRLSPSIILTGLCRGNFAFFESSLAKVAGIPVANAQKLINDKGDLGFKSLYKKAGLPDSMFEPCRLVLAVMHEMHQQGELRPGNINFANRVVEKLFIKANGRDIENMAYIIALIRQNFR
jgi:uncharacterized protein (DUF2336 family)